MTTQSLTQAPSRGLHIGLWVVQALLAMAYGAAGIMKSTTPIETLATNMNWVNHTPDMVVRFIGVSEFLGAVGLILPAALRIQPRLTPVAASMLTLVMLLAFGFHVYLGEADQGVPSLVLGALAAFVAWGRFVAAPIAPRA